MSSGQSSHQFAGATSSQIPGLSSVHCELIIRQGPANARVAVGKEKDRKPIDPPPILQLKISTHADEEQNFLHSPYFFVLCSLLPESDNSKHSNALGAALAGTLVSSLHRLKDVDNHDGAYFVFADLSVKHEGKFRLQFTLYEMRLDQCHYIMSVASDAFPVHSTKNFPGMSESTSLTRAFSEQGVRLRLRKEPRTLLRKRGPAHDDYLPRHYGKSNRQSSCTTGEKQSVPPPDPQESRRRENNDQGEYSEAQASWTQRPTPNRNYSQHSTSAFSESAGSTYEDYQHAKRPRTGSDQSHTPSIFTQALPNPLDNTNFPSRPYLDGQAPSFSQYASAQPSASYSNYSYGQSPQSATASRPNYFPERIESHSGSPETSSSFDHNIARSPHDAHFSQPHVLRFNTQMPYGMTQSPMQHAPQNISQGPMSPTYATPSYGMPPPPGRIISNSGFSNFPPLPLVGRRDSFSAYSAPGTNPNMSAGNVGSLYSQG